MLSKCNFMKFLVMLLLSANVFLPVTINAMEHEGNLQVVWYIEDDTNLTEISRIDHVDIYGNTSSNSFIYHEEYSDLVLLSEIIFIDEYGNEVVERHFTDNPIWGRSASGSGTHRVERTNSWATGTETRWAEGFFSYNQSNNTVSVSNVRSGVRAPSNTRVTNISRTTNRGTSILGREWREVRINYTITNPYGISQNRSVHARVYSNGSRNS